MKAIRLLMVLVILFGGMGLAACSSGGRGGCGAGGCDPAKCKGCAPDRNCCEGCRQGTGCICP